MIEPTAEELGARFDTLASVKQVRWADLLAVFGTRVEGVATVVAGTPVGQVEFGVCWWHDRLGRRHWAFPFPHQLPRPAPAGPPTPVRGGEFWWHDNRHPLEWIAPPLSCGWRERGGQREFVDWCRCGVVGTPEAVGWMGPTCSPCHDREQEGLPPLGIEVTRSVAPVNTLALAPGGRLACLGDPGGGWDPSPLTLTVLDPPWNEPPLWKHDCVDVRDSVAINDVLVAVGDEDGAIDLLDARDGTLLLRFTATDTF